MIYNQQHLIKVVIAAAGQGTRSGLEYPKTLFEIKNMPIIVRVCKALSQFDKSPSIIVAPDWKKEIQNTLIKHEIEAELIVQSKPRGMGDALLQYENSEFYKNVEHLILIWGDIPFIQNETVDEIVKNHLKKKNTFTFPTRESNSAYTYVLRDDSGNVKDLVETRELGIQKPQSGERDIGLFIFRKDPIFAILKEDLPNRLGKSTNEHGFLYLVNYLYKRGFKIEALKIATELDLVSFNSIDDIGSYL